MEKKIKNIFKDKTYNSTLLYHLLNKHPDIKKYASDILAKTPEFESIGRVIIAITNNLKLSNCIICNKLLYWTRCQKQNSQYCSQKCSTSSKQRLLKTKTTNLVRYGVDNPAKLKETQDKIALTCLKRYGVSNYNSTIECKNKKEQTCLKNSGVKSSLITKKCRDNQVKHYKSSAFKQKCFNKILETRLKPNNLKPLFKTHEYKGTYVNHKVAHYMFKCTLCNNEFKSYLAAGYIPLCKCKQTFNISKGEKEVLEYIKSLYKGEIIANDLIQIKPYELDIYIPALNIGIEYNGRYWHKKRELEKPGYHKRKAHLCKEKSIRLINISEKNWKSNKRKSKLKIKHIIK